MRVIFIGLILCSLHAHGWCVKYDGVNLRSSPSPKAKVNWTVSKYTPLLEVGRKGNWINVKDQDGEVHWVYGTSLTQKYICVSIKARSANLRIEPNSSAALGDIQNADKYTPFKRLDIADNGWYKVESNWGGSYWIHPDLAWRPVKIRGLNF